MPPKKNTKRKDPAPPPAEEPATGRADGVLAEPPPWDHSSKKLLKEDTSSVSSARADRLAEANELLAHSQKELAMSQRLMAKALSDKEKREKDKEKRAQIIALFKMYQAMGDADCMKRTQEELLGLKDATPASPAASSVAEDQCSVKESLGDSTEEVVAEVDFETV
jgi:hypothetical protein